MRLSGCRTFAFATVALSLAAAKLEAQMTSREPDAAEVAALLRAHGHAGQAVNVLTQVRGPQPREKMDEIADTLMHIAIAFPGDDLRGAATRGAARTALLLAGVGKGVISIEGKGVRRGVPYSGAAERLMKIVETAEDPGIRGGTLRSLTELPDRARVLPFIRRVATSQNRVAFEAITVLNELTGPEGVAILHELYLQGLVTEPNAREFLIRVAAARGWSGSAFPVRPPVPPLTGTNRHPVAWRS